MEDKGNLFEPLLERVEQYGKTSLKLLKLKAIDIMADATSALLSRFILIMIVFVFVLTINIAISFWLGDVFGKIYYGFLAVASFYGLFGIVLFFIHPYVKSCISNSIIKQMLNEN